MSPNQVIVLQTGYSKPAEVGNGFLADCSVSLIKSPDIGPILVDTSGPWNKDKIVQDLALNGVKPEDLKVVVCTHGHSDHVGNLNLFSSCCKLIVGFDISRGNLYEDSDFKSSKSYRLTPTIEVIATPGHSGNDVSVVVQNTDLGTVVIAGDLFENEKDRDDDSIWKELSENPVVQKKNRDKVLTIADYIVPGHGKMFQVKSGSSCK